jgi:hypothetical protein
MRWITVNGVKVRIPVDANVDDYAGQIGVATTDMHTFAETYGDDEVFAQVRRGAGYTLRRLNGENQVLMDPLPQPPPKTSSAYDRSRYITDSPLMVFELWNPNSRTEFVGFQIPLSLTDFSAISQFIARDEDKPYIGTSTARANQHPQFIIPESDKTTQFEQTVFRTDGARFEFYPATQVFEHADDHDGDGDWWCESRDDMDAAANLAWLQSLPDQFAPGYGYVGVYMYGYWNNYIISACITGKQVIRHNTVVRYSDNLACYPGGYHYSFCNHNKYVAPKVINVDPAYHMIGYAVKGPGTTCPAVGATKVVEGYAGVDRVEWPEDGKGYTVWEDTFTTWTGTISCAGNVYASENYLSEKYLTSHWAIPVSCDSYTDGELKAYGNGLYDFRAVASKDAQEVDDGDVWAAMYEETHYDYHHFSSCNPWVYHPYSNIIYFPDAIVRYQFWLVVNGEKYLLNERTITVPNWPDWGTFHLEIYQLNNFEELIVVFSFYDKTEEPGWIKYGLCFKGDLYLSEAFELDDPDYFLHDVYGSEEAYGGVAKGYCRVCGYSEEVYTVEEERTYVEDYEPDADTEDQF